MCIALWMLDQHPDFWLILALNRDEFFARPTRPAHFWEASDEGGGRVLAGRDALRGGTWLGVTSTGRVAFLTNVREGESAAAAAASESGVSRGDLPVRFLARSRQSPAEFAEDLAREAGEYTGFNLVVADAARREMAFVSNRHREGRAGWETVAPGVHSLSNGTLDGAWHKTKRGKELLAAVVAESPAASGEEIVAKVLRDASRPLDVSVQMAETSCTEQFERRLSAIFVDPELWNRLYGTRSMAVVGIGRDGRVSMFERYLDSGEWKDHSFDFQLEESSTPVP